MSKRLSIHALAIPIFFEMFLRYLSLMINTLGSMGAGNQVLGLFIAIFSFLSVGCSVVIAQALGAKDYKIGDEILVASKAFNQLVFRA